MNPTPRRLVDLPQRGLAIEGSSPGKASPAWVSLEEPQASTNRNTTSGPNLLQPRQAPAPPGGGASGRFRFRAQRPHVFRPAGPRATRIPLRSFCREWVGKHPAGEEPLEPRET